MSAPGLTPAGAPALSIVAGAAVVLLTAAVYWPGLNGPLILDDLVNLDILRQLHEQGRLTLAQVLAERGGVLGGRKRLAIGVVTQRTWT